MTQWGRRPCPYTKRHRHSRYPLWALLNQLMRPARLGNRKLGGPYQKVRAPLFLLPIGREVSWAAGEEDIVRSRTKTWAAGEKDIVRSRTRRYRCFRCPPAPASPLGVVVVFDSVSGAHA
eukprot:1176618-Pleurochrysis_carterae.AAC.2